MEQKKVDLDLEQKPVQYRRQIGHGDIQLSRRPERDAGKHHAHGA